MWVYSIKLGTMNSSSQHFKGYSGAGHVIGQGRNNPAMIKDVAKGPIPPGHYKIAPPRKSDRLGPYVLDLEPMLGTDTFGRSLFRIHGNNAINDASHGCIILPPDARRAIWESGDHELMVVIGD